MSANCVNHPAKLATHQCKRCGKAICSLCALMTEMGVFCSKACYDGNRLLQQKIIADRPASTRRGFGLNLGTMFKRLLILAVLLGAWYGVMAARYKETDPVELGKIMYRWVYPKPTGT